MIAALTLGCDDCRSRDRECDVGRFCTDGGGPCTGLGCVDPPDGDAPDAGYLCEELVSGEACAGRCATATCQSEARFDWSGTVTPDGAPGRPLPVPLFPGGYCAVGCDASRLNDECGDCADCNGDGLAGRLRLPLYYTASAYEPRDGVCRERCTPSRTSTGCARPGYTCDLETSTCMEACVDDRQCQIVLEDLGGDGTYELVDRGPTLPAYCDTTTGRCRTRGAPGARIGDRCTDDAECPDDGVCVRPAGSIEGVCSRLGCRAPGFECEAGTTCDVRNVGWGASGCMRSCRVGAEDGTAAMRGAATGGNPDCGPGLACVWNGLAEPGDPMTGSCVVGVYNDRSMPNVGAPCTSNADCDSPFGYGVCLFADVSGIASGICSVQSCASFLDDDGAVVEGLLPGVPIASPICDPARGEVCMSLGARAGPPETYCLQRCDDASECAPGYACTQLLASPDRYCWPYCYEFRDCRMGTRCQVPGGGDCTPEADGCVCAGGGSG